MEDSSLGGMPVPVPPEGPPYPMEVASSSITEVTPPAAAVDMAGAVPTVPGNLPASAPAPAPPASFQAPNAVAVVGSEVMAGLVVEAGKAPTSYAPLSIDADQQPGFADTPGALPKKKRPKIVDNWDEDDKKPLKECCEGASFQINQKAVGLFQGEEHECRVVAYKVQSVKRVRQYHYRVHWRGRSQKLQSFVPETELQVWTEEKAAELQERAAQIQAAEEAKKAEAEEKKQLAREKKAARLSAKAAQIAAAAQHGDFGSEGGIMPSGGVAMRPVGAPPSSSNRKSKGDDIDLTGLRTVQTTKNHPPYHQLVKIAIHAIKDRNGSSLQAVSKYIINNYFVDEKKCRKATTVALKAGLAKNHIKKVKNSYKLTPAALNDLRAQKRKAEAAKKARENRRGSSDGSGGAAGGGGSRRRSIRFPCPDEWLDTEAHLAAGRPTVAIPDPFPHLAVPGASVGDLFMVWDFFRLYGKHLPCAIPSFGLEALHSAVMDEMRATMPRGPSATLLAALNLNLLRTLCGRQDDGQPAKGERSTDHSMPAARFYWGHFLNCFTWPELLRRYVEASDEGQRKLNETVLAEQALRLSEEAEHQHDREAAMEGDGAASPLLSLAAPSPTFSSTVALTARQGSMRGLLQGDSALARAVAELKTRDYLSLDAGSCLALLRFLVNDIMTVPSIEAKVSRDADEIAELRVDARRATLLERKVQMRIEGKIDPRRMKRVAAAAALQGGTDATGGSGAAGASSTSAAVAPAFTNSLDATAAGMTSKQAEANRKATVEQLRRAEARMPVRRMPLGKDRLKREYWFFPGLKQVQVKWLEPSPALKQRAAELTAAAREAQQEAEAETAAAAAEGLPTPDPHTAPLMVAARTAAAEAAEAEYQASDEALMEEHWASLGFVHELEQLRDALDERGMRERALKAALLEHWPKLMSCLTKRKETPAPGEDEDENGETARQRRKVAAALSSEPRRSSRVKDVVETKAQQDLLEAAAAEAAAERAAAMRQQAFQPLVEPWRHATLETLPDSADSMGCFRGELLALGSRMAKLVTAVFGDRETSWRKDIKSCTELPELVEQTLLVEEGLFRIKNPHDNSVLEVVIEALAAEGFDFGGEDGDIMGLGAGMDDEALEDVDVTKPWQFYIAQVRDMPVNKGRPIKEAIEKAIVVAQRSSAMDVFSKLKEAMASFRANSAGSTKAAALQILEDSGGWVPSEAAHFVVTGSGGSGSITAAATIAAASSSSSALASASSSSPLEPSRSSMSNFSSVGSAAMSSYSKAGNAKGHMDTELTKHCQGVLQNITARVQAGWFLAAVDPIADGIPHYTTIVTEPMDLGTVGTKLADGVYRRADDFARDVRLVFKNAVTFTPDPRANVYKAAVAMDKAFLKKYVVLMIKLGVKSKLSTAELAAWDSSWSSTSSATSTAASAVDQSGAVNSSTEPIDTAVEARKEELNVMPQLVGGNGVTVEVVAVANHSIAPISSSNTENSMEVVSDVPEDSATGEDGNGSERDGATSANDDDAMADEENTQENIDVTNADDEDTAENDEDGDNEIEYEDNEIAEDDNNGEGAEDGEDNLGEEDEVEEEEEEEVAVEEDEDAEDEAEISRPEDNDGEDDGNNESVMQHYAKTLEQEAKIFQSVGSSNKKLRAQWRETLRTTTNEGAYSLCLMQLSDEARQVLPEAELQTLAGASVLNPESHLASSAEAKEFYALPVGINTRDAHQIVWARVQGTWWPARRMKAIEDAYVQALDKRGEMLVVFIGENDLYCVPLTETKDFTGKESDDGQIALQRAIAIAVRLAEKYAELDSTEGK